MNTSTGVTGVLFRNPLSVLVQVGLEPSNRALAQANADLREQIARAEGVLAARRG